MSGPQLIKNSPILWNAEFYYRIQNSPLRFPIVEQINPIHFLKTLREDPF